MAKAKKKTPNSPDKEVLNPAKTKARLWEFNIYPDDPNFLYQRGRIEELADRWAYILHDKDDKKPHYHYYAEFDNPRWGTALCGEVFCDKKHTNQIQRVEKAVMAFRYALHMDDPDKFPYHRTEVHFSDMQFAWRFAKAWDRCDDSEVSEQNKVLALLEHIESTEWVITYTDLIKWSVEHDCYDALRRGASLLKEAVREHNDAVYRRQRIEEREQSVAYIPHHITDTEDVMRWLND